MPKIILVVDGSEAILQSIRYVLEQEGYGVCIATDLEKGIKSAAGKKTDLAIVEYSQAEENGMDRLETFRAEEATRFPVLALVPESQNILLKNGTKTAVDGWILKPFSADALLSAVKKVIDSR